MIIFLPVACEKELEFEYHDVEPQLVIEGVLSQEEIKVALTYTTPMNEKIEENYIKDAEVEIRDRGNNGNIRLEPDDNGLYKAPYDPVCGEEYELNVTLDGKTYSSTCVMRMATRITELKFQWIKMPYDYVAVLQISFMDLETPGDHFWIKIYRNDEPYKWILADDRGAVNGIINEVVMTSRQDLDEEDEKDILRDGDVVKVIINTLSLEMYDYLTAIENNSNGPSMYRGDFCLGYFLASETVSDQIIFRPDELEFYGTK